MSFLKPAESASALSRREAIAAVVVLVLLYSGATDALVRPFRTSVAGAITLTTTTTSTLTIAATAQMSQPVAFLTVLSTILTVVGILVALLVLILSSRSPQRFGIR